MKRTLILDFGGVISKTLFETHDKSEAALGLPTGTLGWNGPFDVSTDDLWRSMQAGEITEREYWFTRAKEVGDLIGENWTSLPPFLNAVRGDDPAAVIRPEALAAIKAAKNAGCGLAILSNELDLFYGKDFRTKLPFLADFDLIVDATYTGILKPDPRAFSFIFDGLSVEPKDCVFVDDQMKNIRGADDCGMQTVPFDVVRPKQSFERALSLLLGTMEPTND